MGKAMDQTAWLLEKDAAQPTYIGIIDGVFEWTTDIDKAFRCARREDADALAEIVEDADKVVEHLWVSQ